MKNIEFPNVEIASDAPDQRPAFWMHDVDGIDLFRIKANSAAASVFHAQDVKDFRIFGSTKIPDASSAQIAARDF